MEVKRWADEEIQKAITEGGRKRDMALYHIFYQRAWKEEAASYVKQNSGNEQDGEDIAQIALVAFDRNLREGRFSGGSSLKTYFFAIVRNQWYKKLRARKPIEEFVGEKFEEAGEDVEVHFINDEKKQYFDILLGKIGERCKAILRLQMLDYSLVEIAAQVGLSSARMARKEAYRCRLRLRRFVEENPDWRALIS